MSKIITYVFRRTLYGFKEIIQVIDDLLWLLRILDERQPGFLGIFGESVTYSSKKC